MNILQLFHNKLYADLLRSRWYKRQVTENPKRALNIKWRANFGHSFPWDNPLTLDEKIGWLQVMTDTSQWSLLADKYEVRKYVKEVCGEDVLIPCYGVWDNVESINFDKLPNQFVIKCTHDSGSTFIVKDKQKEDLSKIKNRLDYYLHREVGYTTFEPHYLKIKPRVVAEKKLESDSVTNSMIDYKFWCFNGKPYCALLCYNRYREASGHIECTVDLYQLSPWKEMRIKLSEEMQHQKFVDVPEPQKLDEMISIAEKLSNGIPLARIDLYNIKGKVYFGEMTFTAAAGNHYYFSESMKHEMGNLIHL